MKAELRLQGNKKLAEEINEFVKFVELAAGDSPEEVVQDITVKEDRARPGQGQEVVCATFDNMLFVTGTVDKTSGRVTVKESTADTFRIMIRAIYKAQLIEEALLHKTVKEVFSVLDLVTKHDIPELLEDTRKVLASFPLTNTILLEEEANQMLLHCAKYLRTAILQYLAENSEQQDVAVVPLVLMKDLKMSPPPTTHDED